MRALLFSDAHFSLKHLEPASKSLKYIGQLAKDLEAKYIFFLGDLFDSRVMIHAKVFTAVCRILEKFPSKVWALVGNHDQYMDSQGETLLDYLPNLDAIHEPSLITHDFNEHPPLLFIPWTRNEIEINVDAEFIFGHLEIDTHYAGFKGSFSTEKLLSPPSLKHVFLGHVHQPGKPHKKITYVGPTFRTSFGEEDITPRAILVDLITGKQEFYELPSPTYKTLAWGENPKEVVADHYRVRIPENITPFIAAQRYKNTKLVFEKTSQRTQKNIVKLPTVEDLIKQYSSENAHNSIFSESDLLEAGLELLGGHDEA